ncbi:molecular chaperone GrpE [Catenuloplanes nepalensis]|uniref:Molecular chaperone GrpE n=1 Tax=Catenuloplanes nepalensis TaxID=587533 RepID=A0ABT9MNX6_9ACTN|nr:nucleotide exchange factor GrpE [Catenuloplanes nepalensis]MDP9793125.1 molecular chaperone GrpE [Catenuloplanes nepalensis]
MDEDIAAEDAPDGGWPPQLIAELAGLRAQIAREHDRAAAREQVIDRLHEDNQALRSGERRLLLLPLLADLRRLRHELLRSAAGLPEQFSGSRAAELLRSYAFDLQLTLERGGIDVLLPAPGDPLDPSAHRAVGTVPAGDQEAAGTLAEILLDGYLDVESGRVVTPAEVRVHRWTAPPEPGDSSPSQLIEDGHV